MAKKLVIMGQGYVGLPLAEAAATNGYQVSGYEVSTTICDILNAGRSHIGDLSDSDVQRMLGLEYVATTEPACIGEADVIVICVPTPLSEDGGPDLRAVEAASSTVSEWLTRDALVVLESTTYPGTTESVVLPILERSGLSHGADFLLAFSPERVDPGNPTFGIRNTPKLVGGVCEEATRRAALFYGDFIETVVPLKGAREAETAKLLENTYRHVNIALVNEMARFCHDLGIDIWEVIRGASTKPFGFHAFRPGPGVGGHCIPIDPTYLSYQVRKTLGYQFRFVELAQEINNSMPGYVVQRLQDLLNEQSKPLRGSRILLLGVTYKPDIADQRESPAVPLARILLAKGAELSYQDPYVGFWRVDGVDFASVDDLHAVARGADAVVLVQNHSGFDLEQLANESVLFFDTRGAAPQGRAVRL